MNTRLIDTIDEFFFLFIYLFILTHSFLLIQVVSVTTENRMIFLNRGFMLFYASKAAGDPIYLLGIRDANTLLFL